MNAQQVSIELNEKGFFSNQEWNDLSNRIVKLFQLNNADQKKLVNSKLGKLVASIPYLAACDEPKRIALSHLTTLYLAAHETGKDVFLHNFTDNSSLLKRLDRISHFDGGNQDIIDRGMNLLALIMLSDHIKDCIEDRKEYSMNKFMK